MEILLLTNGRAYQNSVTTYHTKVHRLFGGETASSKIYAAGSSFFEKEKKMRDPCISKLELPGDRKTDTAWIALHSLGCSSLRLMHDLIRLDEKPRKNGRSVSHVITVSLLFQANG